MAYSTHSGWRWRHSCSICKCGCWSRRRTVSRCTSFRFLRGVYSLPDGQMPHSPSLNRTAAWEREMQRSGRRLCVVHTRLRGRRTCGFKSPSGEGTVCEEGSGNVRRQAGSQPLLRSVSAKPSSRQQCSLTWKISLAGWPPSKSGELLPFQRLAVRALRCWGFLLLRERRGARRYTRIALCLEPAHASVAFVSLSSQLVRSRQKAMCLLANLSTLPKYLQSWVAALDKPRSSRSLEEEFGVDPGVATTGTEHTEVLNCGGSGGGGVQRLSGHAQVQRIQRTRHERPGVIITAHETRVREDLMTLRRDSWSWQCHAKGPLFHHCESSWWSREPSARRESEDSNGNARWHARSTRDSNMERRTVGHDLAWVWALLGLDAGKSVAATRMKGDDSNDQTKIHRDRCSSVSAELTAAKEDLNECLDRIEWLMRDSRGNTRVVMRPGGLGPQRGELSGRWSPRSCKNNFGANDESTVRSGKIRILKEWVDTMEDTWANEIDEVERGSVLVGFAATRRQNTRWAHCWVVHSSHLLKKIFYGSVWNSCWLLTTWCDANKRCDEGPEVFYFVYIVRRTTYAVCPSFFGWYVSHGGTNRYGRYAVHQDMCPRAFTEREKVFLQFDRHRCRNCHPLSYLVDDLVQISVYSRHTVS